VKTKNAIGKGVWINPKTKKKRKTKQKSSDNATTQTEGDLSPSSGEFIHTSEDRNRDLRKEARYTGKKKKGEGRGGKWRLLMQGPSKLRAERIPDLEKVDEQNGARRRPTKG